MVRRFYLRLFMWLGWILAIILVGLAKVVSNNIDLVLLVIGVLLFLGSHIIATILSTCPHCRKHSNALSICGCEYCPHCGEYVG